jgi:hypothetical protein
MNRTFILYLIFAIVALQAAALENEDDVDAMMKRMDEEAKSRAQRGEGADEIERMRKEALLQKKIEHEHKTKQKKAEHTSIVDEIHDLHDEHKQANRNKERHERTMHELKHGKRTPLSYDEAMQYKEEMAHAKDIINRKQELEERAHRVKKEHEEMKAVTFHDEF